MSCYRQGYATKLRIMLLHYSEFLDEASLYKYKYCITDAEGTYTGDNFLVLVRDILLSEKYLMYITFLDLFPSSCEWLSL